MAIRYIPDKISDFYGNLEVYDTGINKGRLNRDAISNRLNISKKELQKAYLNWIEIFRYPDSTLKFSEYLDKLSESGISPVDVGNCINEYNLSRYGDMGSYSKENCRFILKEENLEEQFHPPHSQAFKERVGSRYRGKKLSEQHRQRISTSMIAYHNSNKDLKNG